MAWSTTAPALPAGSSWGGEQTMAAYTANYYKISARLTIARLAGEQVAVRVVFTLAEGSYGTYNGYNTCFHLKTDSEAADDSVSFPSAVGTKTVYWTGSRAAGVSVAVTVGVYNNSASQVTKTFTAPALLALPLYVRPDSGAVRQVVKAYANVGGVIKECAVYANVGGVIKELK